MTRMFLLLVWGETILTEQKSQKLFYWQKKKTTYSILNHHFGGWQSKVQSQAQLICWAEFIQPASSPGRKCSINLNISEFIGLR